MGRFDYAPWARIILRYLIGAVFFGSSELGKMLASDPDLVEATSYVIAAGAASVGAAVERIYIRVKRRGGAT